MTGGGRLPTARRSLLLLNDVNHPRHAVFVGDFTETVRPEGLLPGHFDMAFRSQIVEPAFAFRHVLGVQHQREPGILRFAAGRLPSLIMISLPAMRTFEWAIAESGNCMPDGQPSSLLSPFGISPKVIFIEELCADGVLIKGGGLGTVTWRKRCRDLTA